MFGAKWANRLQLDALVNARYSRASCFAAFLAIPLLLPTSALASADRECLRTLNQVSLRGYVRNQNVFGPPGFGENPQTDEQRSIPVLVLDRPINICRGIEGEINTTPITSVRRVQLIYIGNTTRLRGRVNVSGILNRATNAFHYTRVTLRITKTTH